jgi:hypothetical protein
MRMGVETATSARSMGASSTELVRPPGGAAPTYDVGDDARLQMSVLSAERPVDMWMPGRLGSGPDGRCFRGFGLPDARKTTPQVVQVTPVDPPVFAAFLARPRGRAITRWQIG